MMKFGKDELGKDILTSPKNLQVMMEWEKPYMEHCIQKLFPCGDVLEIGFGLGYSARQIQKYPIRSHTIVECDLNVVRIAREWANNQTNPVNIIHGTWQNSLNLLGKFDYVFYDDFPFDTTDEYLQCHKTFIERINKFHSKERTKIVWYSETPIDISLVDWFRQHNFEFYLSEYNIKKPTNLKTYAQGYGNVMFVPELIIYN